MNLIMAVPAAVSCAVPITAEFKQKAAVASQNVTVPSVSVDPFDTEAVSVTTVPDATDADDSTSVVVVGVPGIPPSTGGAGRVTVIKIAKARKIEKRSLRFVARKNRYMSWAPAERQCLPDGKTRPHHEFFGRG
jgi:hypothetical protein